jgi:RNA polymerase sigma-70 factor, ECF subfamily
MVAMAELHFAGGEGERIPFLAVTVRAREGRVSSSASLTLDDAPMAAAQRTLDSSADPAQFEASVRPVLPRLHRFCLALTGDSAQADDLFQNTLIKAYLNVASFEGRADLVVWICGIARNEYLETRRTEARRKRIFERFVDACASVLGVAPESGENRSPEASAMAHEQTDILLACLQKVPEEFRTVVVLCDIEELGYDRVAEILSVPKGTVKSRHARGRARLRAAYESMVAQSPAAAREEEESI